MSGSNQDLVLVVPPAMKEELGDLTSLRCIERPDGGLLIRVTQADCADLDDEEALFRGQWIRRYRQSEGYRFHPRARADHAVTLSGQGVARAKIYTTGRLVSVSDDAAVWRVHETGRLEIRVVDAGRALLLRVSHPGADTIEDGPHTTLSRLLPRLKAWGAFLRLACAPGDLPPATETTSSTEQVTS